MKNITAKRIRQLRLDLGYTQVEFAKKLKVSQATLSRLETESEHDCKSSLLRKIAVASKDPKYSLSWLLGFK